MSGLRIFKSAERSALFLFGALRRGNTPGSTGERKSFRMRLFEGKQILERKRLNEKEIGKE